MATSSAYARAVKVTAGCLRPLFRKQYEDKTLIRLKLQDDDMICVRNDKNVGMKYSGIKELCEELEKARSTNEIRNLCRNGLAMKLVL